MTASPERERLPTDWLFNCTQLNQFKELYSIASSLHRQVLSQQLVVECSKTNLIYHWKVNSGGCTTLIRMRQTSSCPDISTLMLAQNKNIDLYLQNIDLYQNQSLLPAGLSCYKGDVLVRCMMSQASRVYAKAHEGIVIARTIAR